MSKIWHDVRYALRTLARNPGFTAIAVLTLALGIGATTAVFSVVYASLLAPLPFPKPNQLVMVWSKVDGNDNVVSVGDYLDWKRQSTVFQDLAAWSGTNFNLSISGHPEAMQGRITAPGWFNLQGIPFLKGRDFLPEEGQTGRDHEVILTHRLWQERFGGDPNILGQAVRLNGEQYNVAGILAAGMPDRFESQIFVPLAFSPEQITRNRHWLYLMGRLKDGVTVQQANADMDAVTRHIAEVYPASNKGWSASVEPLQNAFTSRDIIKDLWLLMGAVGFVLLIVCANVANLLLARGSKRHKEVAVRASLGATRGQLFGQFLTESVTLAIIGGVVGTTLAWTLLKAILLLLPPFAVPTEADVRISLPVLCFSLGATIVAGVSCGCVPAWQVAGANLNENLKDGGHGNAGTGKYELRRGLIVIEFALALTLLAGAGLAIHSFWKLTRADLGFRSDHLLTFTLAVPEHRPARVTQIAAFYRQLLERVQALPGITSAAASTGGPLIGTDIGMPFSIAGQAPVDPTARPSAGFTMVTPEYFQTYGMQIFKGRSFTEQDVAGGLPVAIVNESFAKKYFTNADPLRQRVIVEQIVPNAPAPGPAIAWQVVGVYHDVQNGNVRRGSFPEINVPLWQSPWPDVEIAVRTAGDPLSVTGGLAAAVQSMDADLAMNRVRTMEQIVGESLAGDRFAASLFAAFAAVALILAAIGIYGVMSFAVAQRTHEIGLRMALGAAPGQVLEMVLREGMLLACGGLLLGLAGAYAVGRTMKSVLYGISAIDPLAIGAVAAILVVSAALACYLPARRATRVDPLVALRHE
jgi:putative ABC transport system permease protein